MLVSDENDCSIIFCRQFNYKGFDRVEDNSRTNIFVRENILIITI